jgi:hypothetical protein
MDEISREGLVNHEILYFIALNLEVKNSRLVRQALAYIMSDQFSDNANDFRLLFYDKITAGGFFPNFESFLQILCPRMNSYGFSCHNI